MRIQAQMIGDWQGLPRKMLAVQATMKKVSQELLENLGDEFINIVRENQKKGVVGINARGTPAWWRTGTLMKQLNKRREQDGSIVAGALDSDKYELDQSKSVADIARILEYGAPHIPARPLILTSIKDFFEGSVVKKASAKFGAKIQKAWIT